ncbi:MULTISPECIES: hypothetical protein [unclassified Sphingomonas]|uniref:hypothetical protein n=1 Tax=unclassified Sphingomonas TaxID=196159 RepID=UPI0006F99CBD|nr:MULTISPECIES: hypothetical protein [unclassified Sphingomonas]KQX20930.1 hypothetical protein ASD17_08145 [Sphingomonas sp. Root1294]KQY68779.1 hypothetical protein ASD39_04660 [Sphingomonas sp. Root50]KRB88398.1 hypothetical protein ASE22_21835 [Sphingomonas sp. Root720]
MSPPPQNGRTRIAHLFGSDSQSGVVQAGGGTVANEGGTDLWRLRSDPRDFVRLHIPRNFERIRARPNLDTVATVLNLVTDPELNPRVLAAASRFLRGFPGRVVNSPDAVLATGRDRVSRLLAGIEGLVVPAVARFKGRPHLAKVAIERAGVTFPAILRRPGTHNGEIVALVPGPEELEARLDPAKTYLLTSFVDTRDADALYHKIRLYWFGAASLVRHMLVSDRWNVHGPDRERFMGGHPHWIGVERTLLDRGLDGLPAPARQAMLGVRARMPLDYFGIDFALLPDGRALLFEANATMNFYPLSTDPRFDYTGAPIEAAARTLFDRMLETADR